MMKKWIRKHDRIYTSEEYEGMIMSSRKLKPFSVQHISSQDIVDFKNWWPHSCKKSYTSTRTETEQLPEPFNIANCRQFTYESNIPGYLTTC